MLEKILLKKRIIKETILKEKTYHINELNKECIGIRIDKAIADLDKNLSEISNKIVNGAKENNESNSDYVLVSDSFMQSFKEISDDINKQIKQLDGIRGNIDSATYNFAHGFRKGFFGKKESNFVAYEIESQFEGIQEAFDEINKNSEKMTHQRSVTSC